MNTKIFLLYLLVSAGVTYLIRMLPMVLVKKEIKNRFLLSFLHYIPYAVLSAMTVPAIFYATSNPVSATIGFAVALVLALYRRNLVTVAAASCVAVLAAEYIISVV